MNGLKVKPRDPKFLAKASPKGAKMMGASALPASFDWNSKGMVNAVKDQGQCGSCYAFSAAAALESAFAISKNVHTNLSEQNIIDCTSTNFGYNNGGCQGGYMDTAFNYIVKNQGIDGEVDYPYTTSVRLEWPRIFNPLADYLCTVFFFLPF